MIAAPGIGASDACSVRLHCAEMVRISMRQTVRKLREAIRRKIWLTPDTPNATSRMRPTVLDRIERKFPGASPAARVGTRKRPVQRGPKNRPAYRLWEYATWRVRMRAWCNRIKSALLGNNHDPTRPQTYKVLQSEHCPIDNASTWLRWWSGDAIPRPSHVRAADRLAAESSNLLDLSEMASPALRHLVALDILNTKFRRSGRPSQFQRDQSERLLIGLNSAWSPFLSERPIGTANRFTLQRQIGFDTLDLRPLRVDSAGLEWIWKGGNVLRLAVPQSALLEHSWLEPMSIFRFLGALTTFPEVESGPLLQMWALDYASAAMLIRTQLELSRDRGWPVNRMGRAGVMYALAVKTFWTPVKPRFDPVVLELAGVLDPERTIQIRRRLAAARVAYYGAFAGWGIPERAIRALNADTSKKTWDGAFSAARLRI